MKTGGITLQVLGYLIASGIAFAFGEFLSKKFAIHPTWLKGIGVLSAYVLCSALWLPAIAQTNTLTVTGTLWSVISFIATVFIGMVIFNEHVNPMTAWGIAFGLVSVLFLSLA